MGFPKNGLRIGLLFSLLFFILLRFFWIHDTFSRRVIPPEPDDSYHYLYQIRWLSEFPLKTPPPTVIPLKESLESTPEVNWDIRYFMSTIEPYLGWAYPLGKIQALFQLTPEATFQTAFYLGTLVAAFLLFLIGMSLPEKLAPWAIFSLAFFTGDGSYHGFFWVVPSLFTFLIFLALWFRTLYPKPLSLVDWTLMGFSLWLSVLHPSSWVIIVIYILGTFASEILISKGVRPESLLKKGKVAFRFIGAYLLGLSLYWLFFKLSWIPQFHLSSKMLVMSGGLKDLNLDVLGGIQAFFREFVRLEPGTFFILLIPALFFSLLGPLGMSSLVLVLGFSLAGVLLFITHSITTHRFFLYLFGILYLLLGTGFFDLWTHLQTQRLTKIKKKVALTLFTLLVLFFSRDQFRRARMVYRFAANHRNLEFKLDQLRIDLQSIPENATVIFDGIYTLHFLFSEGLTRATFIPFEAWETYRATRTSTTHDLYAAFYLGQDDKALSLEAFEEKLHAMPWLSKRRMEPVHIEPYWRIYRVLDEPKSERAFVFNGL